MSATGSTANYLPISTSVINVNDGDILEIRALATMSGMDVIRSANLTWVEIEVVETREAYIPANSGGYGMELVGSAVVSGSAATSMTVSGLDLAADGLYHIELSVKNVAGVTVGIAQYYNGDTTATNYYRQSTLFDTAENSVQQNDASVLFVSAGRSAVSSGSLCRDVDGYPRAQSTVNRDSGSISAIQSQRFSQVRNNTANVTSITWYANSASSMAVGSYVKVYRYTASAAPYDVNFQYFAGTPTSSQKVFSFVAPRDIDFADDFAGSYLTADTAATSSTIFDVQINGSSVGTITVAAAGTTGTFATTGGAESVLAGQKVQIIGPSTADGTIAGLSCTLRGTYG